MTMSGHETALPGQDPLRERIPEPGRAPEPAVLAARVRAMRRARRDAQSRASRVRRVLLAPAPSGGGTYVPVRHR